MGERGTVFRIIRLWKPAASREFIGRSGRLRGDGEKRFI